ncbi:MAG: FAD-dependent oxidoreductase [Lysobacterales bacterium]
MVKFNRRQILFSGLALPTALCASRSSLAASVHWDYIIVGAGTAGLPAAYSAAKRGARVLLIDPASKIGGTLHMASGQISAAGTKLQADLGIKDSPDAHYDDVMRMTRGLADPDIIRSTVDNAGDTINWLFDGGLVPLAGHPVTGDAPGRPGYSVPRYLWGEDAGRAILAVIQRRLATENFDGQIATQLNTRVTGLLLSDAGAVEGVRVELGGLEQVYRGRQVLLTSGGYSMNPDMFKRLVGVPAYAGSSYPFALGDGLNLAVSAGGWLRGQDLHRAGSGSILSEEGFAAKRYARFQTVPQTRQPWEVWVNNQGQRFIREDEPDAYLRSMAVLNQQRLRYAIVFDQAILDAAPPGLPKWSRQELLSHFNQHPMFCRASTLEDLAEQAGMDKAGLIQTIAEYNDGVSTGDDSLGRKHLPLPILKPPFYAITHLGHSATSSTGIVVNRDLAVLRGDGEPIPNLFAAGEILGSGATLGNAFAPGMMLTPALTLGRLLGQRLPIGLSG